MVEEQLRMGSEERDWHLVKERALSTLHCCFSILALSSHVGTWVGLVLARTLGCCLRNLPSETSNPAILQFSRYRYFQVSISSTKPINSLSLTIIAIIVSIFWSFKLKTQKSSLTVLFPSSIYFTSKFCSFVFLDSDWISTVTVLYSQLLHWTGPLSAVPDFSSAYV